MVKSDLEEAGDQDVYRKVSGDLANRADEATIRTQIINLMAEAKTQLMSVGLIPIGNSTQRARHVGAPYRVAPLAPPCKKQRFI